jgi:hypothetical protein
MASGWTLQKQKRAKGLYFQAVCGNGDERRCVTLGYLKEEDADAALVRLRTLDGDKARPRAGKGEVNGGDRSSRRTPRLAAEQGVGERHRPRDPHLVQPLPRPLRLLASGRPEGVDHRAEGVLLVGRAKPVGSPPIRVAPLSCT